MLEGGFQALFIAIMNSGTGRPFLERFTIWDSQLYGQIAEHGYPTRIAYGPDHALADGGTFAFSPLYPGLVSVVHSLPGVTTQFAELTVTWVAACALSVLVHLLVQAHGASRGTGYLAASLIGALPMSVVFQMGYAEALAAALGAAAALAAARGRWYLAAGLAFSAGLSRPIGFVAAAPVAVIGWRCVSASKLLVVTGVALSSTPLYWAAVGLRSGHLAGWFEVQDAGWHTHFDGGAAAAGFVWDTVKDPEARPGLQSCVAAMLVGAAVLLIAAASRRNLPYVAAGALTLISVVVSTNFWHSKPRLLLGGALMVVPVAFALGRLPLRAQIPVVGFGLFLSAWFGSYMVTQWPYAI